MLDYVVREDFAVGEPGAETHIVRSYKVEPTTRIFLKSGEHNKWKTSKLSEEK